MIIATHLKSRTLKYYAGKEDGWGLTSEVQHCVYLQRTGSSTSPQSGRIAGHNSPAFSFYTDRKQ